MTKSSFIIATLIFLASCSSTIDKVNEGTNGVYNGSSAIERAADSIERAVATGEKIKKKID